MPIRTVLNDLEGDEVKWCYSHEHLIIDGDFVRGAYADFRLDSVEKTASELSEVKDKGVNLFIDSMPMGAGRNPKKLRAVSQRAGVHIVAPTGMHLDKYYPPEHWLFGLPEDYLVERFIKEIEVGMDESDCLTDQGEWGPSKAGVIKVAGSLGKLKPMEVRNFRAAARAHVATGCPILTHTEEGTAAMEQVDILESYGVDLSKVVLSHMDRKPDLELHASVLRRGVKLEYDSAFRYRDGVNYTVELILALAQEFPNQIVLGMDAARPAYWKSYGGAPGMSYLVDTLVPLLVKRKLDLVLLRKLFHDNPIDAYTFGVPRPRP